MDPHGRPVCRRCTPARRGVFGLRAPHARSGAAGRDRAGGRRRGAGRPGLGRTVAVPTRPGRRFASAGRPRGRGRAGPVAGLQPFRLVQPLRHDLRATPRRAAVGVRAGSAAGRRRVRGARRDIGRVRPARRRRRPAQGLQAPAPVGAARQRRRRPRSRRHRPAAARARARHLARLVRPPTRRRHAADAGGRTPRLRATVPTPGRANAPTRR